MFQSFSLLPVLPRIPPLELIPYTFNLPEKVISSISASQLVNPSTPAACSLVDVTVTSDPKLACLTVTLALSFAFPIMPPLELAPITVNSPLNVVFFISASPPEMPIAPPAWVLSEVTSTFE